VQKGDTISGVAAKFGVTVDTILAANPTVRRGALKIGQEIAVLPVSGVLYRARDGETMDSIASLFGVPREQVVRYNKAVASGAVPEGTLIVVPGGRVSAVRASFENDESTSLPSLKGYFEKPTDGFNWGKLHHHNAVDIAASCGTPVWASAEGLVLPEAGGRGYGRFVLIEHPNGTRTRYAHLEQVVVSSGDYVKQRQLIGTVGDTGESTGCHVHFEVYGAKNPFAK
jgi:murein DD-endopeptidase MepM/ murein hydrolase activator NlpD